jgi:hypothetical protein
MARLMDYATAEYIREATTEEVRASIEATRTDGGAGVIAIDADGRILREDETGPGARRVYVEGIDRAIEIVEEYERRGGNTRLAYGLDEDGEVAVSDGAQLPPLAVEVLPMHDGTAVYGPDTPTAPDEWTPGERTAIIEVVAADLAQRLGSEQ